MPVAEWHGEQGRLAHLLLKALCRGGDYNSERISLKSAVTLPHPAASLKRLKGSEHIPLVFYFIFNY